MGRKLNPNLEKISELDGDNLASSEVTFGRNL